jgi:hypothetical protein
MGTRGGLSNTVGRLYTTLIHIQSMFNFNFGPWLSLWWHIVVPLRTLSDLIVSIFGLRFLNIKIII